MKKYLLVFILISSFFISCTKDDQQCNLNDSTVTAPAGEIANVQAYLTANNITAVQHSSGFFYKINQQGTGAAIVNLCSKITIKYVGRVAATGLVFDQTTGAEVRTFTLGGLIAGWQKGVPLISSGGKITLYIPPSLAYGNNPPPNSGITTTSILIFDIELVGVF